mmetsp:Transcript_4664/g.6006  ORF Transcript_4664/g.6006 Transcript_4664/m.6006 type:complete len:105 (+) Transcript_4664:65-379(+)
MIKTKKSDSVSLIENSGFLSDTNAITGKTKPTRTHSNSVPSRRTLWMGLPLVDSTGWKKLLRRWSSTAVLEAVGARGRGRQKSNSSVLPLMGSLRGALTSASTS